MPTAVAPATSAIGLSPIIHTLVGAPCGFDGEVEHDRVRFLVAGGRGGQREVDEVRQTHAAYEVIELGDAVADDHVLVAGLVQALERGTAVGEDRPVAVVQIGLAHRGSGAGCGRLVHSGPAVGPEHRGVDLVPPAVGGVQLGVRAVGTVPGEAVAQASAQLLHGHPVISGEAVERGQQRTAPVVLPSHQGAVEVPQHRRGGGWS
jgi:hypothetical protein